ncbi:hypothetical protein DSO57_1019772 [Entomophthora muscae]|uniref:Uncharacterized protein n=1 Tax=Entomophthora muscae TaxID=34485 RepID=A0ACC2TF87_9FUNG|nr:hypothetical protein DSO57_1019772 [Entomophthora muscae]
MILPVIKICACLVSDDPSSLLLFPSDLLTSREALVKILTCNNLDLYSAGSILPTPSTKESPPSLPLLQDDTDSVSLMETEVPTLSPSCSPWLVTGLVLMGLNSYFPQLSLVSSLWSSLRAAVPVIHWAASWWFVFPGWEPNLVSLAPLSHISGLNPCHSASYISLKYYPIKLTSLLVKSIFEASPKVAPHHW